VLALAKTAGDIDIDFTDRMLSPEQLSTALNKYLKAGYGNTIPANMNDFEVEYDFARQGFRFTQDGENSLHVTTTGVQSAFAVENVDLTGADSLAEIDPVGASDNDPAIKLLGNIIPNGDLIRETRDQRNGITVTFSDGRFNIASGSFSAWTMTRLKLILRIPCLSSRKPQRWRIDQPCGGRSHRPR